jgi:uncharacterized protein YebE (UPF0316 family)
MGWEIPLFIFLARICDVSIGTLRIIAVIRGKKLASAALGFCEVTIWLLAVSRVLQHIDESIWTVIAYGGGFATGTLIGMAIEQRLALGQQIIRTINPDNERPVAEKLRAAGQRVTEVDAHGALGPVEVCFMVTPRRKASELIRRVVEISPRTFITIEDIRSFSSFFTRIERSGTPGWLKLTKFK